MMMDAWDRDQKAAHKRSSGKSATQAKIQWQVDVKGFQARCLPKGDGFVVQFKYEKGWKDTACTGTNVLDLLRHTVNTIINQAEKIPGF